MSIIIYSIRYDTGRVKGPVDVRIDCCTILRRKEILVQGLNLDIFFLLRETIGLGTNYVLS